MSWSPQVFQFFPISEQPNQIFKFWVSCSITRKIPQRFANLIKCNSSNKRNPQGEKVTTEYPASRILNINGIMKNPNFDQEIPISDLGHDCHISPYTHLAILLFIYMEMVACLSYIWHHQPTQIKNKHKNSKNPKAKFWLENLDF